MAQKVECFPSMHKALGSIHCTTKEERQRKLSNICLLLVLIPVLWSLGIISRLFDLMVAWHSNTNWLFRSLPSGFRVVFGACPSLLQAALWGNLESGTNVARDTHACAHIRCVETVRELAGIRNSPDSKVTTCSSFLWLSGQSKVLWN
jgi:hypothetical protein